MVAIFQYTTDEPNMKIFQFVKFIRENNRFVRFFKYKNGYDKFNYNDIEKFKRHSSEFKLEFRYD